MAESRDITAEDARTAAQIEADVGVEHIANVYAKALLDTTGARRPNRGGDRGVRRRAGRRGRPLSQAGGRAGLGPGLAGGEVGADRPGAGRPRVGRCCVNFLKVVARHGRLDCLRAIHCQTHVLYDKLRNRIPVRLTTATPLEPRGGRTHRRKPASQARRRADLQQETDPSLIGGAVLRIGDTVYDGSVANQLQNLRQQMIDRSAHEIQSRRDRFRNPAGN